MRVSQLSNTLVVAVLGLTLGSLAIPRPGHADEKSRRVVNGILRILIESQARDRRPVAAPPSRVVKGTPELTRLRPVLTGYQKESAGLYGLLQTESQQHAQARALLPDSLRFRSRSDALARRSVTVADHRLLRDEAAALDRDWRVLSYRLRQVPGLAQPCRDCIGRLDQSGTQLCDILQFKPQVDRRTLVRHSDALVIYLRGLIEDLEFELARTRGKSQLIVAAGETHQSAVDFAEAARDGVSYQKLVVGFRRFLKVWGPFSRAACRIESRFIERSVLRIQQVDRSIHELLWLPRELDREHLLQLTAGIGVEVDRIFNTVTLAMLIQLPSPEAVPNSASEFYGVCANFADYVRDEESREDLVDAYQYLPAAWVSFSRHFRSVNHPTIRRSLAEIESRLVALREPLGIPGGFNLTTARRHAASIQHLAEHLSDDIEEWLAADQYDRDRRELETLGTVFMHSSRKLNAALAGTPHLPTIQKLCDQCVADWSQFHGRVAKCNAPDRDHLEQIELRITTALVDLEAMLL